MCATRLQEVSGNTGSTEEKLSSNSGSGSGTSVGGDSGGRADSGNDNGGGRCLDLTKGNALVSCLRAVCKRIAYPSVIWLMRETVMEEGAADVVEAAEVVGAALELETGATGAEEEATGAGAELELEETTTTGAEEVMEVVRVTAEVTTEVTTEELTTALEETLTTLEEETAGAGWGTALVGAWI
jgi:hypothetical protein